ncbi:probable proteasome inhibitor [Durio zibethinus]|uniref:Probable proteasome inhibitor n=1 Tax=Durio zibethinus TaxID=66656 RepID=A0A6P5Z5E8_DURZI|nr:probable proteasome inhibitor [Durio zibethinus]
MDFRGGFGGGYMHLGPNDSRWFSGERGSPGERVIYYSVEAGPNDSRWFSGERSFPEEQAYIPPGARFDPYGPPGARGFERNRFVRDRVVIPPINPFRGSDAFPGPAAGVYPVRRDSGGGDMLIGPNDPRWFSGEHGSPGEQAGIPPGARFDPFGPPGVPGFEPYRFVRNRRRRPGAGTHPDLEHFGDGSNASEGYERVFWRSL